MNYNTAFCYFFIYMLNWANWNLLQFNERSLYLNLALFPDNIDMLCYMQHARLLYSHARRSLMNALNGIVCKSVCHPTRRGEPCLKWFV